MRLREKIAGWREDEIRNRINGLLESGARPESPYVRDCTWLLTRLRRTERSARRWALLAVVLTALIWAMALIPPR